MSAQQTYKCTGTIALMFGVFFKTLPGIGSLISTVAMPVLAGGCTYAIGQVFVRHYESGGTLLTFNAATMKEEFARQIKAGEEVVHSLKDKVAAEIKGP